MNEPVSKTLIVIFTLGLCAYVNAEAQVGSGYEHNINFRLAKIEMTLERVLKHNKQLEQRIEALEEENQTLKKLLPLPLAKMSEFNQESAIENHMHRSYQQSDKNRGKIVAANDVQIKPRRQLNPDTVAFTAVVSPPSLTNVGAGQTIIFDRIVTNVGNAYHSTTGIFIAPVSGVYVFSFSEMIDPGNDEYLELIKEGKIIIFNYGHASHASHLVSSSRTATVELKAGEEVWVRTAAQSFHGTGIIHGNSYTSFSGWLISTTA